MIPFMQMAHDLLTVAAMLFGVFFMTVGAVGLARMPDLYHRMHAATKCVTLGIAGLLIAAAISLITLEEASPVDLITKVLLVIVFQFVANPVGAHLLSKAAHLDGCNPWQGTLSDELEEDSGEHARQNRYHDRSEDVFRDGAS